MIIDGKDLILGRMASYVAKNLLKGEEVILINAGEVIISGNKKDVFRKYKQKRDVGDLVKGPFITATEEGLVKRAIRGMLPWHKSKGRQAFKRLKVYKIKPEELKGEAKTLKQFNSSTLKNPDYVKIEEIVKWLVNK